MVYITKRFSKDFGKNKFTLNQIAQIKAFSCTLHRVLEEAEITGYPTEVECFYFFEVLRLIDRVVNKVLCEGREFDETLAQTSSEKVVEHTAMSILPSPQYIPDKFIGKGWRRMFCRKCVDVLYDIGDEFDKKESFSEYVNKYLLSDRLVVFIPSLSKK